MFAYVSLWSFLGVSMSYQNFRSQYGGRLLARILGVGDILRRTFRIITGPDRWYESAEGRFRRFCENEVRVSGCYGL